MWNGSLAVKSAMFTRFWLLANWLMSGTRSLNCSGCTTLSLAWTQMPERSDLLLILAWWSDAVVWPPFTIWRSWIRVIDGPCGVISTSTRDAVIETPLL